MYRTIFAMAQPAARASYLAVAALIVVGALVPPAVAAPGSPTFTSPNSATFSVGVAGSFQATATGTPLPTISRKGTAPPASISFTAVANTGVGTLSGTPVAGNGGVYSFKFRAVNGVPPSRNQNFTLTINDPPRFTSFNSLTCASNQPCSITITTAGFPQISSITLSSGVLPAGMSLVYNGNGTATLSGTPTTAVGAVPLQFTATNTTGTATQSFTLTVNNYLAITSAPTTTCTVGTACSFAVTVRGTNTVTANGEVVHVALTSGTLPAGITFVDNNNCAAVGDGPCIDTGMLSGTPAAGAGGLYSLQFTGTDGTADADAVQGFTLIVNEAPAITSINNITCIEAVTNCDFDVVATGYPVPATSLSSGTLPSLLDSQASANIYSVFGVADSGTAGVYPLVFSATNGVAPTATQNFALTVVTAANAATVHTDVIGAGTGRVQSTPTGIDCPGSCDKIVALGTSVTLTATPAGGSVFVGWLGAGCTGNAATCTFAAASSNTVSATFAPAGTVISLDVDASGTPTQYDAASDGVMLARYLFGYAGAAITQSAHVTTMTGRNEADTRAYIELIRPVLDIDGDGKFDALTDGLLIVRYMLGLRSQALTDNAVGSSPSRTGSQIEALLGQLMP